MSSTGVAYVLLGLVGLWAVISLWIGLIDKPKKKEEGQKIKIKKRMPRPLN